MPDCDNGAKKELMDFHWPRSSADIAPPTREITCCGFVKSRTEQKTSIVEGVRKTFQVTPGVTLLPRGTVAKEFEANVKAPRFVDKRG
jgi:hypothetical protein